MKTRNLEEYLVKQEEKKKANLPSVTWPLLGKVSVVVEKLFIFAICVMKGTTSVRWQLIFVCCSCKRLRWIIEIQRKQQLRLNENRLNRRLLNSGSSREFFVDECRSVVFSTTKKFVATVRVCMLAAAYSRTMTNKLRKRYRYKNICSCCWRFVKFDKHLSLFEQKKFLFLG